MLMFIVVLSGLSIVYFVSIFIDVASNESSINNIYQINYNANGFCTDTDGQ